MKLILASTIACSSAQYASAKSNDAKAEKPVASQFINQQAQATQRTITGCCKRRRRHANDWCERCC